jgi:autotransporter-associated beta strand protein
LKSECGDSSPSPLRSGGEGRAHGAQAQGKGGFLLSSIVALSLLLLCTTAPAQTSQQTYLQCLTNFETYAESIWVPATYVGAPADSGYWGDGGNSGNGGIRGNSGIAVAYATLVVALPGDPRTSTRLSRIRQALNYDAATHVTGASTTVNGGKWGWSSGGAATCTSQGGADWQTAEWSGSMALACLLVQSNLPAATVSNVQTVVASEANHRASIPPCTRILSDGDTKAEENAWDGNILALAAAWMTNNANASNWLFAAKDYLVNTYTVSEPDLITPNTSGDPLASWISTVTIFPSYALENHGFYHPTYEMVAGMSSGDSLLMAHLADTNTAAQLLPYAEHNVMAVWTNNMDSVLTDTGDFTYPAGVDWSVRDFEHNSYITWIAAHFNDPLARWADNQLSQCVRYRQQVNGDGTFIGVSANPGGGILFYREAVEARRTAIAWLQWANADFPSGPTVAPTNTLMYNTDVQVIQQRSSFGTFSINYDGSRTMAMIEPEALSVPTNAFIASPRIPGILGLGALGNPTGASVVSFNPTTNGFTAELRVTSSLGITEEYIDSTGESIAIIEVPRLNAGSTASSGGSFICGIENDPLTGGSRLLEWTNNSISVTALSGTSMNISNNWICVSGRYGLAAGPAGYFQYAANTTYQRVSTSVSEAGEAEDALSFVENNQLAPRYAVWFPTKNALQTSNSAAAISWSTNTTNATLVFPGAGGTPTTLIAFIGISSTNNNGAWAVDADGNWSNPGNWNSSLIADGIGFTADFSAEPITADRTVTLDTSRNIGVLKFGDLGGANNWIITNSGGGTLTLNDNASSPPITVANTATLALPVAGASGFTKSGTGTLVLSGNNPLSGILFLDSGSTSANDGAVRVTTSAALANANGLMIRNNSGANAASTLQLDGSTGNVVVAQDFTNSCRANIIPNVENLSGSNVLTGNICMQTGGSNVVFASDNGTLALTGTLQYIGNLTSGRYFNFFGTGDFNVPASILFSSIAPIGVGKYGSGTLFLSGANTFTNTINLLGGTINFLAANNLSSAPINLNGGTLQFAPGNSSDISGHLITIGANGGTIDTGINTVAFANGIGNKGSGALTKTGPGALILNGTNTFRGGTVVNAGTLAGIGILSNALTVLASGTLSPGVSIGNLTINGTLTNFGTLAVALNKTGSVLTNSTIKGLSNLVYGGTLQLNLSGNTLAPGDSFRLFFSTNYFGAFANITPTNPGPGLAWNTNNLTNGTISVVANPSPRFTGATAASGKIILAGSGGYPGGGYSVLANTNVIAPVTGWTVIATSTFDSFGNFANTNPILFGTNALFYRIRVP